MLRPMTPVPMNAREREEDINLGTASAKQNTRPVGGESNFRHSRRKEMISERSELSGTFCRVTHYARAHADFSGVH
jgi:hypothetical protein